MSSRYRTSNAVEGTKVNSIRTQGKQAIKKKEAAEILGISLTTLYRLDISGEGPRRIKLSQGRVGYMLDEVLQYLDSRQRVGVE